MRFHGLKKVTLIDYPKHIACTAFTHGCTLRCPFCHNPELVIEKPEKTESIGHEALMEFLGRRTGKLDGIVFTGGEPLMHTEKLMPLLQKIRDAGLLIKIDTNGTLPAQLQKIAAAELVDFVAMDFKTSPEEYDMMGASSSQTENILQTLDFLTESDIEYEIRTTVVPGLHTRKTLRAMLPHLRKVQTYVLQNFEPNGTVDPAYENVDSFSPEEMNAFLAIVQTRIPKAKLRG